MKNATKHADDLKSLLKRLTKECKPNPLAVQDPLLALVRGAMSFDVSDNRAEEAMRVIEREFVGLNELRVATELEVQDLLGAKYPAIERRVAMITQALNRIFEREHTLSLDRLKTISKRDARQFLRDLPEIHPFVEAYVLMFAFGGHAFPLDDEMLAQLREQGILDDDTAIEEGQKFVEHHLKAEECFDLYSCLRKVLWDEKKRKK